MIYAHIFGYMRDAHYYAYRFIDEHRHEIEKIKKPSIYIVILKNGDEHHFLSRAVCDKWRLGKTYMIGVPIPDSGIAYIFDDGSSIEYIGKAVLVEGEKDE